MDEPKRFDRVFFDSPWHVTSMGSGELGGKAQGLQKVAEALRDRFADAPFRGTEVNIPRMTVIRTDVFDAFMDRNGLWDIACETTSDERIAHAFQRASLPAELVGDLRAMAREVHVPLAVRSSSLLEDAMYRPFAGVYGTKMIPNNRPSADDRFNKLADAIKFVYASTFFKEAKAYQRSVGSDVGREKMAVIVQEVVGQRRGDRFYPCISGVARSHNYYPSGRARPEDGVLDLALGLGKTIVDGGFVWSISPAFPKKPPPFKSRADLMRFTQRRFWAVNMGQPPQYDPMKETEYLVHADLDQADYDDVLRWVASTYLAESDRIVPGTGFDGPRIINFAPILEFGDVPLNDLIKELLVLCEQTVGSDVELEFAMDLDGRGRTPPRFGFLQVRPMVVSDESVIIEPDELTRPDVIISSKHVLGHGERTDIRDIVYVSPQQFDAKQASRIAADLEKINATLEGQPYLLIGVGRWGTTDPFCGIPVNWSQISGARVIVESALPGVSLDLSQGSHFFHNVTSLKVFYLSVPQAPDQTIDWGWLDAQAVAHQGAFARHVHLDRALRIRVDGRSACAVIQTTAESQ